MVLTPSAMTPPVRRHVLDKIAVVCLDVPPINAIGAAVRGAIADALDEAAADDAIVGVLITAAGKLFSGGGDLREIGQLAPAGGPTMTELTERIETFDKPVGIAIHGRAIGGGVLLALACHARLASPGAVIALPEVRLGFVPGAGGTQRLPRLVGAEQALEMIALAKEFDADAALAAGFFDEKVSDPDELIAAGIRRLSEIAAGVLPWRRTSTLAVKKGTGASSQALGAQYGMLASEVFRDRRAPREAITLVLQSEDSDFAQGIARERAVFEDLSQSLESRALLHLFFAERALLRGIDSLADAERSALTVRPITSPRRPKARIIELLRMPDAQPVDAALKEAKASRRIAVLVEGGSIAERLDAAYLAAASALEREGFSEAEIAAAAVAGGLPSPFSSDLRKDAELDARISAKLLEAMVAAAKACLADGMVARAADIDLIAVEACGFPATLGGPLFFDGNEGEDRR